MREEQWKTSAGAVGLKLGLDYGLAAAASDWTAKAIFGVAF